MKVKVLKIFRDKYTGEKYMPGKTLEIAEGRYEEIKKHGNYVKKLECGESEEDGEEPEVEMESGEKSVKDLEEMTVQQLRKTAKSKNLSTAGGKEELIERIEAGL